MHADIERLADLLLFHGDVQGIVVKSLWLLG
jgi:hypothetical protein